MSAYGLYEVYKRGRFSRVIIILYIVFCLITPYVLQEVIKYGHIFQIYERNNKNISLTWQDFWKERKQFSEVK